MKKYLKNKFIVYLVIFSLATLLMFILLPKLIYKEYTINGTSMQPTLLDKEKITVDKLGYKIFGIKRYDIIIFRGSSSKVIKRVIGLPGERVEYLEGNLYINGKIIEEPFLNESTITKNFNSANIGEYTIPKDSYFVVGDNRGISIDSRKYGSVQIQAIIGIVKQE